MVFCKNVCDVHIINIADLYKLVNFAFWIVCDESWVKLILISYIDDSLVCKLFFWYYQNVIVNRHEINTIVDCTLTTY